MTVFRDTLFLAAGPASERSRSALVALDISNGVDAVLDVYPAVRRKHAGTSVASFRGPGSGPYFVRATALGCPAVGDFSRRWLARGSASPNYRCLWRRARIVRRLVQGGKPLQSARLVFCGLRLL